MSSRKRGGGRSRAEAEEEEEGEEEEEEETQRKRPARQRRPSQRAPPRRAVEEEEEEEEEEEQGGGGKDDYDESEDDEPTQKRKRGGDKPKRRSRSSAASQPIDTGGEVFTQAEGEDFVDQADASQETLRPQDTKSYEGLTNDQRKALLSSTIRYIIMKGSNKEAIKKNKLWEEVLKSQNVHKSVMRPVLKEAREYLEKTFGYQLIQLPDTKFPGSAIQDSLFLITGLRMPGLSQQINTYGKDVGLRGLIMVVLSLIFCAGTKIEEKDLFQQLSKVEAHAQVESKGRGESEFVIAGMVDGVGELDAAFETMKRELYILREKGVVQDDGTFTYHYKLGPRAFVEVGRKQLVQFIAETLGQTVDPAMLQDIEQEDKMQEKVAEVRG